MKGVIRDSLNITVKESEKGVRFNKFDTTYFFKVADNSLWGEFNLIKGTAERLEKMRFYKKSRGYGECYNFLDSDYLTIEYSSAIKEAYALFAQRISEQKKLYNHLMRVSFSLELLPSQTNCTLFWLDLAGDFLEMRAPDVIANLHHGFRMNSEMCFSYEDKQLRGICAHERKRDGTAGNKLLRMYLKSDKIIRFECCFDKNNAGDSFPRMDLSTLQPEQLKNCIAPLENLWFNKFDQIQKDPIMKTEQLSTDESKYELLKTILNLLDGNLGKGNMLHIGNLIEHGYIQSRVVQDYRLLKKTQRNEGDCSYTRISRTAKTRAI